MGLIGSLKCCCSQQVNPSLQPFEMAEKKIVDDYHYFLQENWYRFNKQNLFDLNKFIFLFSNYAETQKELLERWKMVDMKSMKFSEKSVSDDYLLSYRWKFTIRRGVPISFMKHLIQFLFRTNISNTPEVYQRHNSQGMKIQIKPNTFQGETQEIFKTIFLNHQGEQALKRISFFLTNTAGKLSYCPFLINVISCLLIFVKEGIAYKIIQFLIDSSFKGSEESWQNLQYHLTLNQSQFQKLAEQFYKKVKKICPIIRDINDHLNTQGIEKKKIFKEIVGNFFFGYLPFGIILRILMIYLNEGISVLYRIYYSMLKIAGPTIRDSTSNYQILKAIKYSLFTLLNNCQNFKPFFKSAFDLKLEMYRNSRLCEATKNYQKSQDVYYLPSIQGSSEILSYQSVQVIWGFLPQALKHYDLKKIYPQQNHQNSSLKKMIEFLNQFFYKLIIIKSWQGSVFGVFLADKIKDRKFVHSNLLKSRNYKSTETLDDTESTIYPVKDNNYFGSSDTFVFTLSSDHQKFSSTGENIFYYKYSESFLLVGGPDKKPALQLDSSLNQGLSFPCPTYNNIALHRGPPGEFRMSKIQCFAIC